LFSSNSSASATSAATTITTTTNVSAADSDWHRRPHRLRSLSAISSETDPLHKTYSFSAAVKREERGKKENSGQTWRRRSPNFTIFYGGRAEINLLCACKFTINRALIYTLHRIRNTENNTFAIVF
jgi:hypothetical protein